VGPKLDYGTRSLLILYTPSQPCRSFTGEPYPFCLRRTLMLYQKTPRSSTSRRLARSSSTTSERLPSAPTCQRPTADPPPHRVLPSCSHPTQQSLHRSSHLPPIQHLSVRVLGQERPHLLPSRRVGESRVSHREGALPRRAQGPGSL
jgi:hypothetical protein